jgi:hypothetical protein
MVSIGNRRIRMDQMLDLRLKRMDGLHRTLKHARLGAARRRICGNLRCCLGYGI